LPLGRADLAASVSLQGIGGGRPQLPVLCLMPTQPTPAATSTHE